MLHLRATLAVILTAVIVFVGVSAMQRPAAAQTSVFTTCQSFGGGASPNPTTVGTTVVVVGFGTCPIQSPPGQAALFQFWVQDPVTGWHLIAPYAPGSFNEGRGARWTFVPNSVGNWFYAIDIKRSDNGWTQEFVSYVTVN